MLDPDRPFLISPPFGSYLRHPRAYSVLGSFTRHERPGRTMQVLRTVRPLGRYEDGSPRGWVNQVGLRNRGWEAAMLCPHPLRPHQIASVALITGDHAEWEFFVVSICALAGAFEHHEFGELTVEINISCPNTGHAASALPHEDQALRLSECPNLNVIWKLPPIRRAALQSAKFLLDQGARYLHCSNTLPSPVGGLSGAVLREVNLPIVEKVCEVLLRTGHRAGFDRKNSKTGETLAPGDVIRLAMNGYVEVIAGGGIYEPEHLRQYRDAGATRFSMTTAWFNPLRALRVMRSI